MLQQNTTPVNWCGNFLYTSGNTYENKILGHPLFFSADPAAGDRRVDPAGLSQPLCCREPLPASHRPGKTGHSIMDIHPAIHAIHLDTYATYVSWIRDRFNIDDHANVDVQYSLSGHPANPHLYQDC